jgi:hypothetical protein
MERIGAGRTRGVDDLVHVEIRGPRVARSEGDGLVEEAGGVADVVVGRVREDGDDAHLAAGAGDAHRDLAAVRDY